MILVLSVRKSTSDAPTTNFVSSTFDVSDKKGKSSSLFMMSLGTDVISVIASFLDPPTFQSFRQTTKQLSTTNISCVVRCRVDALYALRNPSVWSQTSVVHLDNHTLALSFWLRFVQVLPKTLHTLSLNSSNVTLDALKMLPTSMTSLSINNLHSILNAHALENVCQRLPNLRRLWIQDNDMILQSVQSFLTLTELGLLGNVVYLGNDVATERLETLTLTCTHDTNLGHFLQHATNLKRLELALRWDAEFWYTAFYHSQLCDSLTSLTLKDIRYGSKIHTMLPQMLTRCTRLKELNLVTVGISTMSPLFHDISSLEQLSVGICFPLNPINLSSFWWTYAPRLLNSMSCLVDVQLSFVGSINNPTSVFTVLTHNIATLTSLQCRKCFFHTNDMTLFGRQAHMFRRLCKLSLIDGCPGATNAFLHEITNPLEEMREFVASPCSESLYHDAIKCCPRLSTFKSRILPHDWTYWPSLVSLDVSSVPFSHAQWIRLIDALCRDHVLPTLRQLHMNNNSQVNDTLWSYWNSQWPQSQFPLRELFLKRTSTSARGLVDILKTFSSTRARLHRVACSPFLWWNDTDVLDTLKDIDILPQVLGVGSLPSLQTIDTIENRGCFLHLV